MRSYLIKNINAVFSRNISTATSDIIRTVDASQISKPFSDEVREGTYKLYESIKAGNAKWSNNFQVSDKQATKLAEGCKRSISKSNSPKKEEFERSVSDFRNYKFPVLLLKGIQTPAIDLPEANREMEVYGNPNFRIATGILTGFVLGPLGLQFQHSQDFIRVWVK